MGGLMLWQASLKESVRWQEADSLSDLLREGQSVPPEENRLEMFASLAMCSSLPLGSLEVSQRC